MKRAILTCALVLTGLACAARPRVEAPASADGQESLPPELLNQGELNRAKEREYPRLLKERGIGSTTIVWVFIDQEGIVRDQRVNESSGRKELDDAALRVVPVARFSPATNRGEKVSLWIEMEVTFLARLALRTERTRREAAG